MHVYNNNLEIPDINEEAIICTNDSNSVSKAALENEEMKKKVIIHLIDVSLPTLDDMNKYSKNSE